MGVTYEDMCLEASIVLSTKLFKIVNFYNSPGIKVDWTTLSTLAFTIHSHIPHSNAKLQFRFALVGL